MNRYAGWYDRAIIRAMRAPDSAIYQDVIAPNLFRRWGHREPYDSPKRVAQRARARVHSSAYISNAPWNGDWLPPGYYRSWKRGVWA